MTSNKTRHIESERKLNDHINSYTKLINDLLREVKLTSTKGLAKDLINRYNILNGAKYFAEDCSQNHFLYFNHYIGILKR